MSKVSNNAVLRYAVPFYFESSSDIIGAGNEYQTLCNKLSSQGSGWKPELWGTTERDTFEYLYRSLFYESNECHIGSGWRYELSENPMNYLYYPDSKDKSKCYDFSVTEMGLYLFRTNVGILWYEASVPVSTEGQSGEVTCEASFLAFFQNRFKELNYRHQKYFKSISPEGVEETMIMGDVIHGILQGIFENIHYLNGVRKDDENSERPDKALIFNYILLKDEVFNEVELHEMAFIFANGYNDRYHMPKSATRDFVEPFADTCWYASRGGCGYFAYMNSQENNGFFLSVLPDRIRGDYFFMYILALYQSYSILNYLRRIMQYYPADPKKYFNLKNEGDLDKFTAEINTFLMKGMYSSVSNIHHHNRFFQYLQKQLSIKDDIESITMGVDAMAKVQRLHNEKEEARLKAEEDNRNAKRDAQLNLILTVISVLSVFSALVDMHEFMDRLKAACGDKSYIYGLWSLLMNGDLLTYFQLIVGMAVIGLAIACVGILVKNLHVNRKKDKLSK